MKFRLLYVLLFVCFLNVAKADLEIQPNSLLHQTWKKFSQSGEEGVIDEILHRLNIDKGFFVEFGALDGIFFSNTRFLAERDWNGAFIESNGDYLEILKRNCSQFPNVMCLNEYVRAARIEDHGRTFDEIAEQYFPDVEIDVMSIDIDGLDYLVFEDMRRMPKIVCIESSCYWHPKMTTEVPIHIAKKGVGQPLPLMYDIAIKKGYVPVCFVLTNLILVRKDLSDSFSGIKNDPETLWMESWKYIGMFQPGDQRYVSEVREQGYIKHYDPYPTPPLTCQ